MTEPHTNHENPSAPETTGSEKPGEEATAPKVSENAADEKPEIRRPNSLDPWVRYKQRSQRVREEVARNRRGEYRIPTWGLVAILIGMLGVWAALIWFP